MNVLKKNQRIFERARKIANVGYWAWHTGTNELEMSDEMYQILGFKKEDGIPLIDANAKYVHPDDRKKLKNALSTALKNRKPYSIDYRIFRADNGKERYIQLESEFEKIPGSKDAIVYGFAQDITGRRQAEEALKSSEERLKIIYESAPDAIYLTDLKGTFIDGNKTAEDIMGYNREELIGKSFLKLKLLSAKESQKASKLLMKNIQGKGTGPDEFLLNRKDGKQIPVEISTYPVNINNKKLVLGIARDITERNQAEQKLIESEDLFTDFFENAPIGFHIFGPDKIITEMNDTELLLIGYTRDEIIGKKKWSDLIIDEQKTDFDKHWQQLHKTGKVTDLPYTLVHKKGHLIKVILNASARFSSDGILKNTRGSILDITKRKQAEEALEESEERFRRFGNAASEGIGIAVKGIIKDVNNRLVLMTGYSKTELIGNSLMKIIYPDDQMLVGTRIKSSYTDSYEFRILRKDGSTIYVESRATNITYKGKLARLAALYDITHRKQAEEALKNSEDRYHLIFDKAPDAYFISDLKGKTVDVNTAMETTLGLKKEDVIGKNFIKLGMLSKNQIPRALKLMAVGIMEKPMSPEEFTIKRQDGSKVDMELRAHRVKISNKMHILGIVRDITERKKFLTDLMEREEKYRTLTQNLNVGVYRSNPGKNGKIIEANLALIKLFGLKNKNDLERWWAENFYQNPIERDRVEDKLKSKGFLINEEIKLKKIDGTKFYASISATAATDDSGKVIHYDGIIEDITERIKVQKNIALHQRNLEMLSNELAITQEKTKRELAITLHDKLGQALAMANFKTSELNKKTTDSENKKELVEISSFIEEAINESRNITYELSPPILYEMGLIPAISWKLDEIEKNNQIKTSLKDRSKTYELEEKEQIVIYRTINELLQNVIKHSKADKVNISFSLLKKCYRISVSDNGIGFDLKAVREKAISQKKFGLFSIMERIKYIGGEINIDTALNKGTDVIINLPINN